MKKYKGWQKRKIRTLLNRPGKLYSDLAVLWQEKLKLKIDLQLYHPEKSLSEATSQAVNENRDNINCIDKTVRRNFSEEIRRIELQLRQRPNQKVTRI